MAMRLKKSRRKAKRTQIAFRENNTVIIMLQRNAVLKDMQIQSCSHVTVSMKQFEY